MEMVGSHQTELSLYVMYIWPKWSTKEYSMDYKAGHRNRNTALLTPTPELHGLPIGYMCSSCVDYGYDGLGGRAIRHTTMWI